MTYHVRWKNARRHKFNAKTKMYNGRTYHSKREAEHAMALDWMKKAGEIAQWHPQHKVALKVNGHHICNYYPDFLVILPDGSRQIHEVKGFATEIFRLKWKLFEALLDEIDPGAELIIVK